MSNSGHLQALLNPPGNPKAKYFKAETYPDTADEWMAGAAPVEGSWWPRWDEWLSERSGEMKKSPRSLGNKAYPPTTQAPGEYVFT